MKQIVNYIKESKNLHALFGATKKYDNDFNNLFDILNNYFIKGRHNKILDSHKFITNTSDDYWAINIGLNYYDYIEFYEDGFGLDKDDDPTLIKITKEDAKEKINSLKGKIWLSIAFTKQYYKNTDINSIATKCKCIDTLVFYSDKRYEVSIDGTVENIINFIKHMKNAGN